MKKISLEELKKLYRRAPKKDVLPFSAQSLIDRYFHLKIQDKIIATPYFINAHTKLRKRSLIGKGTPIEIEKETLKQAKKDHFSLTNASSKEIKAFMIYKGIGVDCSGLVTWILNELTKDKRNKKIYEVIDFKQSNLLKKIKIKYRPVENINVRLLRKNSRRKSLRRVQPGDCIVTENNSHVLIVTEVGYTKTNKPLYFKYVNSKIGNGVKEDTVVINDIGSPLEKQKWIDLTSKKVDVKGIINQNHTKAELVRLNALSYPSAGLLPTRLSTYQDNGSPS